MIQSVQIQNFKSVVDLTLEFGTFNVLIGANGCGKSNILEAIAFGAAASADKLDQEFLGSRGIRMTSPEFIVSAFYPQGEEKGFDVEFASGEEIPNLNLSIDLGKGRKWEKSSDKPTRFTQEDIIMIKEFFRLMTNEGSKSEIEEKIRHFDEDLKDPYWVTLNPFPTKYLSNYILYSPEQTSLRKFEDTNQIYPLGIKGEGLFQYLKELSQDEKNVEVLNEIKECLLLLDWYEDFKLPKNLMSNEFALSIKDKYLNENLQFFDQRSTNEGFLFLLFYATLFTSKDTPPFFAIDNIDASFNPKLCMQVTKMLAQLAKKHGKQVIVTTQNPAILDGLDLQDDDQRLFVVRRNEDGHTKAKRIAYKAERTMKLSEVWTNGFIGGLPDNF